MKNYAGHRLSPWLGHLMVSRQETARPLLTPGEVMRLPATDELILVSGAPPIRAKKARYFEDRQLQRRILAPPDPADCDCDRKRPGDDWTASPTIAAVRTRAARPGNADEAETEEADGGVRRAPDLPIEVALSPEDVQAREEFDFDGTAPGDDADEDAVRAKALRCERQRFTAMARQAALDPGDGIDL